MRVIAVVNQKGGVGKTTTTANLGHALAERGLTTWIADLDPQAQLANCVGIWGARLRGMDDVLLRGEPLHERAMPVRDGLSLIPSGSDLADFEYVQGGAERSSVLRNAIENSSDKPDVLLLDCPPSIGMSVINAVTAADDVLTPLAGDYLSLTGLARLMLTLKRLLPLHPGTPSQWIFFSRFIPRRRLAQEVYGKVRGHFADKMLRTSINEAAVLAESAAVGKTVIEYRSNSRAAREYRALADDLINERVVSNEQEAASNVA